MTVAGTMVSQTLEHVRPSAAKGFLIEAHLFDFKGDLYGQKLEVEFVKKLRDEAHFEDIDDLVVQMREDERQARYCLVTRRKLKSETSTDKHGL